MKTWMDYERVALCPNCGSVQLEVEANWKERGAGDYIDGDRIRCYDCRHEGTLELREIHIAWGRRG